MKYFYLEADDICLCGHRRDNHDYSKKKCMSSYLPDHNCSKCSCYSWNLSYRSEFILPWKRLYWRLFKGYKTPLIKYYSKTLNHPTKEDYEIQYKENVS